mmetsp:Transcript_4492/g.9453  ORF Transcript_4492/g.9453 Transcript_4492/m.9453 type:complete len:84 (+) Transcript_4492:391-642(+)
MVIQPTSFGRTSLTSEQPFHQFHPPLRVNCTTPPNVIDLPKFSTCIVKALCPIIVHVDCIASTTGPTPKISSSEQQVFGLTTS